MFRRIYVSFVEAYSFGVIVCHLNLICRFVLHPPDYIMLELLKNSMRATVEWHGVDGDFPPIKIVIADGSDNEDVVIKISDEGKLHVTWK